jgi:hypothetical protein
LAIRDSLGVRIGRYGEEEEIRDRYVRVEETLEAVWGSSQ